MLVAFFPTELLSDPVLDRVTGVPASPASRPEPSARGRAPGAGGRAEDASQDRPAGPAGPPATAPEALHPGLWRADQLGRAAGRVQPSGFPALDDVLPGSGWPCGALTELLLPHPGVGEWRLLAPALTRLQRGGAAMAGEAGRSPRSVMLFDPPARPCAWTLAALGLALPGLLIVHGGPTPGRRPPARAPRDVGGRRPPADLLWAIEQALASGQLGAVLAWLPARLAADTLRRLQIAAQAHPGPVFLFRGVEARSQPSAASLRLLLTPGAPDELRLRVLKRRGPPLRGPLSLALPPVLGRVARERARAARSSPAAPSVTVRQGTEALPA
jgi:protein ImuA